MSDAEDKKNVALDRLKKSIDTCVRNYQRWLVTQWVFTAIIAAAGAFTAFASKMAHVGSGSPAQWYEKPLAVFLCGVIGAVVAALNQGIKPGEQSQRTHQTKFALHRIEVALEDDSIDAYQANDFHIKALKNPDEAIERLISSRIRPK